MVARVVTGLALERDTIDRAAVVPMPVVPRADERSGEDDSLSLALGAARWRAAGATATGFGFG